MGKYTGLTGSERAIMNNPWRQPGVDYHQHFPALKELNISIMEETFYPGLPSPKRFLYSHYFQIY
jgi:hypothetical protein